MPAKQLDGIQMGETWTSYMAAVYGALAGSGLWRDGLSRLIGMTGIGFHFIIHDQACASSATVYDWQGEHLMALDRIGVHSQNVYYWNLPCLNAAEQIRSDAVAEIKASIDRGIPVVIWAPTSILEFGIIDGYDDQDRVFSVKSCDFDPDPLLYDNLGCSEVSILSYQIIKGKIDVNKEKIVRDSLSYGLAEWKKDFHINSRYASGKRAYDNLIRTLKNGDFEEFGLTYLMAVYADAKTKTADYLKSIDKVSKSLRGLDQAAQEYALAAEAFVRIAEKVPFRGPSSKALSRGIVDRQVIPEVLELVHAAKDCEAKAMLIVEDALF